MLKFKHSYCNKCVIVSTMVIEKHIRQMASKQNTPTAIHKSLFHRRKFDNDQETVTRKTACIYPATEGNAFASMCKNKTADVP